MRIASSILMPWNPPASFCFFFSLSLFEEYFPTHETRKVFPFHSKKAYSTLQFCFTVLCCSVLEGNSTRGESTGEWEEQKRRGGGGGRCCCEERTCKLLKCASCSVVSDVQTRRAAVETKEQSAEEYRGNCFAIFSLQQRNAGWLSSRLHYSRMSSS